MTEITIRIGEEEIYAVLDDTPAARDFLTLLPLTLTLKDYAGTEKVADLPRKLEIEGEPAGYKPVKGDIAHYAPWGNIAIFYKDFGYSPGLVRLGETIGPLDALLTDKGVDVRVERAGS